MPFGLIRKSNVDKYIKEQINKALIERSNVVTPKRIRRTRNEMTEDWLTEMTKKALIKSISGGRLPKWLQMEEEDEYDEDENMPEDINSLDVSNVRKWLDHPYLNNPIAKSIAKGLGFDVDVLKAHPEQAIELIKSLMAKSSSSNVQSNVQTFVG